MVVAAYIEQLSGALSPASVKQHLAALRMLFDWLVVGQVLPFNPASSVRGPKHVVKTGKTPVLSATETVDAMAKRCAPTTGRRYVSSIKLGGAHDGVFWKWVPLGGRRQRTLKKAVRSLGPQFTCPVRSIPAHSRISLPNVGDQNHSPKCVQHSGPDHGLISVERCAVARNRYFSTCGPELLRHIPARNFARNLHRPLKSRRAPTPAPTAAETLPAVTPALCRRMG